MGLFDWLSNKKSTAPAVFDPFDATAKRMSTDGRRWDGSKFSEPYRPPPGYDSNRKDLLPRNCGSEVRQHADGSVRGIASAELVKGQDGMWRPRFDGRPRRRIDDDFLR
jgi:hypothetical protein